MSESQKTGLLNRIPAESSMLIVLVMMIAVLSALTMKQQNPAGADAGQQVGATLAAGGAKGGIAIVAEKSPLGKAFVDGVTIEQIGRAHV